MIVEFYNDSNSCGLKVDGVIVHAISNYHLDDIGHGSTPVKLLLAMLRKTGTTHLEVTL